MMCQYKDQKRHVFLSNILREVNLLHLTFLLLRLNLKIHHRQVSTRRITFKRPLNPLERAEPPKRTRADDDEYSALLSVYHRDLGRCLKI